MSTLPLTYLRPDQATEKSETRDNDYYDPRTENKFQHFLKKLRPQRFTSLFPNLQQTPRVPNLFLLVLAGLFLIIFITGQSRNSLGLGLADMVYSKRFAPKSRGYVYNNALTLSIIHSPYIYPDISKLEEYRRHRKVELLDGTKVASKTHAIVYKPKAKNGIFFKNKNQQIRPDLLNMITVQGDTFEQERMDPPIVLVVGLDADRYPRKYLDLVIKDRLAYAKKHGYGIYIRYLQDFQTLNDDEVLDRNGINNIPRNRMASLEFAKISLMREAMFSFSSSAWFWWLDQDAIIMNQDFDIGTGLVFNKKELSRVMFRDKPIVPPESIVHTYKRNSASKVKLIMLQNDLGINMSSFLVRQDQLYGRVLMDYLMDPLHRKYQGFQDAGIGKALDSAMTHLLQWHPLILTRMALVPPAYLGAYPEGNYILKGSKYRNGDLVYLLKSSLIGNRGVLDADFIMDEWLVIKNNVKQFDK